MGFIRNRAVKQYKKEITAYTDYLESLNPESLGEFLVLSVWSRSLFQMRGVLNRNKYLDPTANIDKDPELNTIPFMRRGIEEIMKIYREEGMITDLAIFKLWWLSLLAMMRPEINENAQKMWDVILKSKKYWNKRLEEQYNDELDSGLDKKLLKETFEFSKEILKTLPPKQIFNPSTIEDII